MRFWPVRSLLFSVLLLFLSLSFSNELNAQTSDAHAYPSGLADELVSEGYVAEHPEMATYYPWADDDRHMFDPWADVPKQQPESTGEQRAH